MATAPSNGKDGPPISDYLSKSLQLATIPSTFLASEVYPNPSPTYFKITMLRLHIDEDDLMWPPLVSKTPLA